MHDNLTGGTSPVYTSVYPSLQRSNEDIVDGRGNGQEALNRQSEDDSSEQKKLIADSEHDSKQKKSIGHWNHKHVEAKVPFAEGFHVVKSYEAKGDVRLISFRHLTYFLSVFERWYIPRKPDEQPDESKCRIVGPKQLRYDEAPPKSYNYWLALAVVLIFAGLWSLMKFYSGFHTLDATVVATMIAGLATYITIFASTRGAMYHGCSFYDGFNVVTRFTTKLCPMEPEPLEFEDCNYPATISCSVSSRGTTLNKLMILVCSVIGFSLFIKFSSMPNEHHLLLIAFSYLLISVTGLFENRTFNLDEVDSKHVKKARLDHHRKSLESLEEEDAFEKDESTVSGELSGFRKLHFLGVGACVGLTFVGFIIDEIVRNNTVTLTVSLSLSLASVVLGCLFLLFNAMLDKNVFGKQSYCVHRTLACLCIAIEFLCLICATLAGAFYPHQK